MFEHDDKTRQLRRISLVLSVVDSLPGKYSDCHVVLGGDLNVDFSHHWAHTEMLNQRN